MPSFRSVPPPASYLRWNNQGGNYCVYFVVNYSDPNYCVYFVVNYSDPNYCVYFVMNYSDPNYCVYFVVNYSGIGIVHEQSSRCSYSR
jgi:hypothetical protein